jgi:hypothetical protein
METIKQTYNRCFREGGKHEDRAGKMDRYIDT